MKGKKAGRRVRVCRWLRRAGAACVVLALGSLAAEAGTSAGDTTAQMTAVAYRLPLKADRILVLKKARRLELLKDGAVLKTYPIALGSNPIGRKHVEGDGKTPEGLYTIDARQPLSHYHFALHISYPNAADRARAAASGRDPGGDIMIHGLPNGYRGPLNPVRFEKDWTNGCISVGDRAIDEIAAAVQVGTPIEIRP